MSGGKGLLVLNVFAAIKGLGERRLQELCDNFRSGYLAREFAISRLEVRTVKGQLSLEFAAEVTHSVKARDEYFFPTDELLGYIVDQGIADDAERKQTKAQIKAARERNGPNACRRFVIPTGPKFPLFIRCKKLACGNLMLTDLTAYRCERIESWRVDPMTCARCKQTRSYSGADLHFGPSS